MNKTILLGRLTRDPECTTSASGTVCARFSIAVDRKFKREGDPTADFFNCVSFGKQGEFVEKYLKKGTKVVIVGHLQNDTYTNKEGVKTTTTKVYTDEIEFAESKGEKTEKEEKPDFLDVPDIADLPFS